MPDLTDRERLEIERRYTVRPDSLTVRVAALIIAHGGQVDFKHVRSLAFHYGYRGSVDRPDGTRGGASAGRGARVAVRALTDFDLATREGNTIRAVDLGDLACWLADILDVDDEDQDHDEGAGRG